MRTTLTVGVLLLLVVLAPGTAAAGGGVGVATTHGDAGAATTHGGAGAATTHGGAGVAAADGEAADGEAAEAAADGAAGSSAQEDDACEAVAGGEQRPDPEADTLGWENGCWHDDPIDVDRSDGLNETELEAVVARAMARVEFVRELEFEATVPVEVVSREQFRERSGNRTVSEANRLHQNVKWEAVLMVNESTDAVAVRQANRGATVGGFYSPSEDRIVIVSENTTTPKIDEITLSQELFHALQDQQFDVGRYNQSTEELHNAKDGIIEGDGNYVDFLYEQRCGAEWDCLEPRESGGGGADIHVGQFLVTFAPYSEGPEFVRGLREEGGWAAVNAVYENPPASTEQVIHPEKYPNETPTTVTVEDRSAAEWRVPQLEGGVNFAQFGEAGIFTMFWFASFEASSAQGTAVDVVIPYTDLFNYESGPGSDLEDVGPYSYADNASTGWAGDRLYPYVRDDSATTNETGYVWKIEWDTEADAAEFVAGYAELLSFRGAEEVSGHRNTYRIPEGQEYADAFYVNRTGSTVVVVNAPSVEALSAVRAGAAPAAETATDDPPATDDEREASTSTTAATGDGEATPSPTETSTPGFGAVVAVGALLGAVLALRRR